IEISKLRHLDYNNRMTRYIPHLNSHMKPRDEYHTTLLTIQDLAFPQVNRPLSESENLHDNAISAGHTPFSPLSRPCPQCAGTPLGGTTTCYRGTFKQPYRPLKT